MQYIQSFTIHINVNHIRNPSVSRFIQQLRVSSFSSSIGVNSINSALRTLKLDHNPDYTSFELRDAYFAAAKMCHPDSNDNKNEAVEDCTVRFLDITNAYELLQDRAKVGTNGLNRKSNGSDSENDSYDMEDDRFVIHESEEEKFRNACRDYLGLDADTVEESKRCPLFREWLKGKTDASFTWNNFFMLNGGLAPMLNRKKVFQLSNGDNENGGTLTRRRRRRK